MSKGVNKVIIIGRLGKDPEVRYTPSGTALCNISVATSESWKDKVTGEKKEQTEWHSVSFFGKLAEIAGQYLSKGAQAYIEGSLKTEKWVDKNNIERYTTKIIAKNLQMIGGGKPSSEGTVNEPNNSAPPFEDYSDVPF